MALNTCYSNYKIQTKPQMNGEGLNPGGWGEEEKGKHCHSASDSDGWGEEEQ